VAADVSATLHDDIVTATGDRLVRITDRETNDAVATALDRVDQIRNLSVLFSFIFVLLAILAMYTSTRRLVEMQVREIATLKSSATPRAASARTSASTGSWPAAPVPWWAC